MAHARAKSSEAGLNAGPRTHVLNPAPDAGTLTASFNGNERHARDLQRRLATAYIPEPAVRKYSGAIRLVIAFGLVTAVWAVIGGAIVLVS